MDSFALRRASLCDIPVLAYALLRLRVSCLASRISRIFLLIVLSLLRKIFFTNCCVIVDPPCSCQVLCRRTRRLFRIALSSHFLSVPLLVRNCWSSTAMIALIICGAISSYASRVLSSSKNLNNSFPCLSRITVACGICIIRSICSCALRRTVLPTEATPKNRAAPSRALRSSFCFIHVSPTWVNCLVYRKRYDNNNFSYQFEGDIIEEFVAVRVVFQSSKNPAEAEFFDCIVITVLVGCLFLPEIFTEDLCQDCFKFFTSFLLKILCINEWCSVEPCSYFCSGCCYIKIPNIFTVQES